MQPFFFIHIPKTAGTSLRAMLAHARPRVRCFPSRWRLWVNGGRYPGLAAYENAVRTGRHRCLAGHLPVAAARQLGCPEQWVLLRDPVDRALSNLRHLQRNVPEYRALELEALASRRPVVANHLWNLQCQFLQDLDASRMDGFRRGAQRPEIDLESALANLQRCRFVGITEQFAASVALAERTGGFRLPSLRHDNRGADRHGNGPSDALCERLAAMNQLDRVLYDTATQLFEDRCRGAAATPAPAAC